jgi:uncharacterized protein (TIGR03435 family)
LNLQFDVASVKPVKDCGNFQRFRNTPGALEVRNMQPAVLIRNAYRLVMEGQLTGEPRWADDECFDMQAKADEDPTIALAEARNRNLLRLQSLLTSRFQLKAHWQNKRQPAYVLLVAKSSPRLKPSLPGAAHATRQGRGTLACTSCSLPTLAVFLSNFLKRPVQDDTGIQGLYDIDLAFEPLDNPPSQETGVPSLAAALQDQLGLKLGSRKLQVKSLVVDHIEHPSLN